MVTRTGTKTRTRTRTRTRRRTKPRRRRSSLQLFLYYSENSKTVSRSFTWLTSASPRSSHLGLPEKVWFPMEKQRLLRKCASVCSETRLQRSWSLSTQILEIQRVSMQHEKTIPEKNAESVLTLRIKKKRLTESSGCSLHALWSRTPGKLIPEKNAESVLTLRMGRKASLSLLSALLQKKNAGNVLTWYSNCAGSQVRALSIKKMWHGVWNNCSEASRSS